MHLRSSFLNRIRSGTLTVIRNKMMSDTIFLMEIKKNKVNHLTNLEEVLQDPYFTALYYLKHEHAFPQLPVVDTCETLIIKVNSYKDRFAVTHHEKNALIQQLHHLIKKYDVLEPRVLSHSVKF